MQVRLYAHKHQSNREEIGERGADNRNAVIQYVERAVFINSLR